MRENIAPDQVVLHSDNGSPMKGATLLNTLQALGVTPSFSRPAVSNDNPYSESLFKTMKYRPAYPGQAFESLLAARRWVGMLIQWYNHEHRHSAIHFVTPAERWNGVTRNWQPVRVVHLNPDQYVPEKTNQKEVNLTSKVRLCSRSEATI